MPDDVFTQHHQDAVPIHRNMQPVAECDVHAADINGRPCKAIDVPILSCASVWLRLQKEAEAWIAPGGKLIEDKRQRNRQINQAYAQLWQADRRFQWAGLAAFASKQVGCGLLHAAENIEKSQAEMVESQRRMDIMNSADGAAVSVVPSIVGAGSAYMYEQLALGNTLLFLDIYPLHRFYMLRGVEHLKKCLSQRAAIAGKTIWPIQKDKLPFGQPYKEILEGFDLIDQGRIAESIKKLAQHEQINILQAAIYDDIVMQNALRANQFSWATGFLGGSAAEIELTLSAECLSKSNAFNIRFSKNKTAKLYDKGERMTFVYAAATRFDTLLHDSHRPSIEAAINAIANTGGMK